MSRFIENSCDNDFSSARYSQKPFLNIMTLDYILFTSYENIFTAQENIMLIGYARVSS